MSKYKKLTIFADSDVIISSLISQKGAAYLVIHSKQVKIFISNISVKELLIVVGRLNLEKISLINLIKERLQKINLSQKLREIKAQYKEYVFDLNNSHIIAAAVKSDVRFLISYNIRHFRREKIKRDFDMIVYTPAQFLQFIRSL